jgi:hypothetical protein
MLISSPSYELSFAATGRGSAQKPNPDFVTEFLQPNQNATKQDNSKLSWTGMSLETSTPRAKAHMQEHLQPR